MPKRQVDVTWRDHRVGSCHSINWYGIELKSAMLTPDTTIREIAELPIVFDPNFAELRGITGVELE